MFTVDFAPLGAIPDERLRFVVIVARHDGRLVLARHRERTTLEIPGGHIEPGEAPIDAARRELYEETGAVDPLIEPVAIYGVHSPDDAASFGLLCRAEVGTLGPLPPSEIAEVLLMDECPDNLTYPDIQPRLLAHVQASTQGGTGK